MVWTRPHVHMPTVSTHVSFLFIIFSGVSEAVAGGKALKNEGHVFDVAHTSVLQRAQTTLATVLKEIGQTDLPIEK